MSSSIQVSQLFPAGFRPVMASPSEPTRDSLPYSTAWRSWATPLVSRREAARQVYMLRSAHARRSVLTRQLDHDVLVNQCGAPRVPRGDSQGDSILAGAAGAPTLTLVIFQPCRPTPVISPASPRTNA